MKKLIALLLCCVLLVPALLSGVAAEEAAVLPALRVRYSVSEENVLSVRGSLNPKAADAAQRVPDDTELTIVVYADAEEKAASKTVTVKDGKFSAAFSELHGVYFAIRVYQDKQSIAKIAGPIYVGVVPKEPSDEGGTTPPEGGTTPPEGGATPPEGGTTPPEGGTTPPEGGTTPPEGGTTPPEGGTTPPEGGTTPPEGGTTPPEGGTTPPEGGTTPPEGGTTPPESGTTPPEGGTTPPESGTTPPESGTTPPEGGTTPPESGTTPPESGTTPPEGGTTPPEGGTTPPEGDVPVSDGSKESLRGEGDVREGVSDLPTLQDDPIASMQQEEAILPMEAGGIGIMAVTVQITASLTDETTISYSGVGDAGTTVDVFLMRGAVQLATAQYALDPGGDGSFSGTFAIVEVGAYEVWAQKTGDVTSRGVVQVSSKPKLAIDPISDASAVVMGRTAPDLKIEISTIINGKYSIVETKSDFRGAFYAAMNKRQKAGMEVWVTAFYVGGKVTKLVYVQRASDLPSYSNNLSFGQYGSGVLAMQQRLKDLGYDVSVSGDFDAKTLKAVFDFQRLNHLAEDGIGGPVTRALLFSVTAREYTSITIGTAGVLQYGDDGSEVKALQRGLRALNFYSGSVSGLYRSGTRSAVRAFERRNNLPVDGIADRAMQALLYSTAAKKAPADSDGSSSSSSSSSTTTGTTTPVSDASKLSTQLQPVAANEMAITSEMVFGVWDTLLEKTLVRGKLRVEAEGAYPLLDMQTPGMLLRVSYVDANGKVIPCRVRWTASEGKFVTRDDSRSVISEQTNPFTAPAGEVYWSLTPYLETMRMGTSTAPLPKVGQDNMIFWLDKPLVSAQAGRTWSVTIEALDISSDQLVLDSAMLSLMLGEGGVVTLNEDALRSDGWTVSAFPSEEDEAVTSK